MFLPERKWTQKNSSKSFATIGAKAEVRRHWPPAAGTLAFFAKSHPEALLIKNASTVLANKKRNSPFNSKERNKKKAQKMVDPFEIELDMPAR